MPSPPRLELHGDTARLSLAGLRVLDVAALSVLEQRLAEVEARQDRLRRLILHNPADDLLVGVDTAWILSCMQTDDFRAIADFVARGQAWLQRLDALDLTTVGELRGLATGAGAELLAALDVVVATPDARIGLPETGIGIHPALGGTQRVPRRIGLAAARWMVLTGEYVGAVRARTLGWVDRIVAAEQLGEAAGRVAPTRERASRITRAPLHGPRTGAPDAPVADPVLDAFARLGLEELRAEPPVPPADPTLRRALERVRRRAPIALRVADALLWASTRNDLTDGLEEELRELATVYATEDARVGLRAAAAGRRAARFHGR